MKVKVINTNGQSWTFNSVKESKPHIKKDHFKDYAVIIDNGEKVRVYDDRKLLNY